jgi:hypothetical protein
MPLYNVQTIEKYIWSAKSGTLASQTMHLTMSSHDIEGHGNAQ